MFVNGLVPFVLSILNAGGEQEDSKLRVDELQLGTIWDVQLGTEPASCGLNSQDIHVI